MSLEQHLSALEAADLIRQAQQQPELEYLFRHAMVQDAVYGSLLRNNRRALHQAVGELLEKENADGHAKDAALLAHHFMQAGDTQRALRYLELAGDSAAGRFALAESLAHYGHAWQLAHQVRGVSGSLLTRLALGRGRVLELSGRFEEALATYSELQTLGEQSAAPAVQLAALMAQAVLRATPTPAYDTALGTRLIERTLSLAHSLGDRQAEAKILWISMVLVIYSGGDWENAQSSGERALELVRTLLASPLADAETRALRELQGVILHDLPFVYAYFGRTDRAALVSAEAIQLLRTLGNLPLLTETLVFECNMRLMEGQYAQALELAAESRAVGDAGRHEYSQSYGQMLSGRIFLDRGEFAVALPAMAGAIAIGERAGNLGFSLFTRSDLAWGYAQVGAFEQALPMARRAQAIAAATAPHFGVMARAIEVRVLLLAGDSVAAQARLPGLRAWYTDVFALRSRLGAFLPAWTEVVLAEISLALAVEQPARAQSIADDYIVELKRGSLRHFLPEAFYLKGRALVARNDMSGALQAFQAAQAEAEFLGARRHLWLIFAALAELAAETENRAEACALRQASRAHIEFIAAHCGEYRQSFLALPEVSAVCGAA